MRRVRALLLLSLLCCAGGGRRPAGAGAGRARHVVLISIDGLRPDYYLPSTGAATTRPPRSTQLRARGSWAEGVLGQFPSLTYPSHTSIVTGRRGRPVTASSRTRRSRPTAAAAGSSTAAALKVPALVGRRASGRSDDRRDLVAGDASARSIDYLLPETNQAPRDAHLARPDAPAVDARAGGRRRRAARRLRAERATATTCSATGSRPRPPALIIEKSPAQPAADPSRRGRHGAASVRPELAAGGRRDRRASTPRSAQSVKSIETAGMAADTAVIVTGDHGFYRVHSAFQPNVVLREAGLLHGRCARTDHGVAGDGAPVGDPAEGPGRYGARREGRKALPRPGRRPLQWTLPRRRTRRDRPTRRGPGGVAVPRADRGIHDGRRDDRERSSWPARGMATMATCPTCRRCTPG